MILLYEGGGFLGSLQKETTPMPAKKKQNKTSLPPVAEKALRPFIDKGIANGIFKDDKQVVEMFKRKAADPSLKDTIDTLGGIKSQTAQSFLADIVRVDLSAILRQRRYTAHLDVWQVQHRTVGAASGNPRPVCFLMGQAVVEDGDSEMEPALFKMGLWDEDASLGDDIESGGHYQAAVTCRNLDDATLNLNALSGFTVFNAEEYEHHDPVELLRSTFEVTPIADLEDDISRGRDDFRLVEAQVSYSGVQNSKNGGQFGKIILKDESTMTMEAIESGDTLNLNCICATDVAARFGKYSRILALVTTRINGEYGLSGNLECAVGIITVAPPTVETPAAVEQKEDDASDYFKGQLVSLDDDEEDDDDDQEDTDAEDTDAEDDDEDEAEEAPPAKPAKKTSKKAAPAPPEDDDEDEDDDGWLDEDEDDAEDDSTPAEAADDNDSDDDDEEDDWDDWE